jgi:hypothetical protein
MLAEGLRAGCPDRLIVRIPCGAPMAVAAGRGHQLINWTIDLPLLERVGKEPPKGFYHPRGLDFIWWFSLLL